MPDTFESYFRLTPEQFLQALLNNPRCLMAVKGAVAEEHLALLLNSLQDRGVIGGYQRGGEGQPDFFLDLQGRQVIVECKMVQKTKPPPKRPATHVLTTIDFKKTRTQNEGKHLRFYRPGEFDVIGACLFNLTGQWDFVFAPTAGFVPHRRHDGRLSDQQIVLIDGQLLPNWSDDLESVLQALP